MDAARMEDFYEFLQNNQQAGFESSLDDQAKAFSERFNNESEWNDFQQQVRNILRERDAALPVLVSLSQRDSIEKAANPREWTMRIECFKSMGLFNYEYQEYLQANPIDHDKVGAVFFLSRRSNAVWKYNEIDWKLMQSLRNSPGELLRLQKQIEKLSKDPGIIFPWSNWVKYRELRLMSRIFHELSAEFSDEAVAVLATRAYLERRQSEIEASSKRAPYASLHQLGKFHLLTDCPGWPEGNGVYSHDEFKAELSRVNQLNLEIDPLRKEHYQKMVAKRQADVEQMRMRQAGFYSPIPLVHKELLRYKAYAEKYGTFEGGTRTDVREAELQAMNAVVAFCERSLRNAVSSYVDSLWGVEYGMQATTEFSAFTDMVRCGTGHEAAYKSARARVQCRFIDKIKGNGVGRFDNEIYLQHRLVQGDGKSKLVGPLFQEESFQSAFAVDVSPSKQVIKRNMIKVEMDSLNCLQKYIDEDLLETFKVRSNAKARLRKAFEAVVTARQHRQIMTVIVTDHEKVKEEVIREFIEPYSLRHVVYNALEHGFAWDIGKLVCKKRKVDENQPIKGCPSSYSDCDDSSQVWPLFSTQSLL